jgi:hemoglobin/transferrin/lactoferrin receptor protein
MLAFSPGIRVQKSQFGGGSPVIRGMEANRVVLVVDGVRMNNAIYRKGHLQNSITVSPLTLDRTEVLFGPSSVMYGSDALGGVIHFYTKGAPPSDQNAEMFKIYNRYNSINNEITNQITADIVRRNWSSFTSINRSQFGDLRMGKNRLHGYEDWGLVPWYSQNTRDDFYEFPTRNSDPNIQRNTGFTQYDFLQKFQVRIDERISSRFNIQYSTTSDIPRFDRLTEYNSEGLKFAEWSYGPQDRLLLSNMWKFDLNAPFADSFRLTGAYQHIEEERIQRRFGSKDRSYRHEYVDVFSFNGDFSKEFSPSINMSYGFEFTFNGVASRSRGEVIETQGNKVVGFSDTFKVQSRYPDGGSSYNNQALYLSSSFQLNNKSKINTGIRFTATQLSSKWNDYTFIQLPESQINLNNQAITANLSYVVNPNENWQGSVLVSTGFRSPNVDDVGKIREKNGFVSVPNVDLKPEYAYTGELNLMRFVNKRKFNFGVNVYYTLLDHYIERAIYDLSGEPVDLDNPPTIIYDGEAAISYANVNKGSAYIYGGTISASGSLFSYFNTQLSATYTKGRSYDSEQPLSSIPPLFATGSLDYKRNKLGLGFTAQFNAEKRPEDYNIIEGIDNIVQTPLIILDGDQEGVFAGTPAWYRLNARASYSLNSMFEVQLIMDNITDNHYKEFASGLSAAGRSYIATLILTL